MGIDKQTVIMFGNLLSLQAEIEGMKLGNELCRLHNKLPMYEELDFQEKARQVQQVLNKSLPISLVQLNPNTLSVKELERAAITKALLNHGGRRKDASVDLGFSERTLYRKIREYQLEDIT